MRFKRVREWGAVLLVLALVCLLTPAWAGAEGSDGVQSAGQKDPGKSKADQNDADKEVIDTLVITGNRSDGYAGNALSTGTGLDISPFETPQSVSIITSQQLEDQGIDNLTDVVNIAPGLSAKAYDESRFGFSARGFYVYSYQIDGVPIAWGAGSEAGESMTDTSIYERIEIVRGATGLLTGVGDPSASINMVRKHADSKEFTGFVSGSAGRWDAYDLTADMSLPLNTAGSIRGRVMASFETQDSYIDLLEKEKSMFYATVDADLSDHTLFQVGASYQENDPEGSMWGGLPIWYSDGTRTDWDRSKTTAADWTSWASTNESLFANLTHELSNGWKVRINASHVENEGDLKLLYLYGQVDKITGLGLNALPGRYDSSRTQDDIEVRLTGTFDALGRSHDFALGGSFSTQDLIYYSYAKDYADVGNFYLWDGSYPEPEWGERTKTADYTEEQIGVYAATRLALTDAAKLILGSRIASWNKEGMTSSTTEVDYGDDGVLIPYAGLLYSFNAHHKVYLSYTEIFNPQNYQDRNGTFLDPLTGKDYEAGLKSSFFDGALNTSACVFKIEQDNLAQADGDYMVPGSTSQAYTAVQGTESVGFELEVTGEVLPGWNISASYTQFTAEDADGENVNTRYPTKLFKVFTTYRFGGRWDKLTIGGGLNWEGSSYYERTNSVTGNTERLEQSPYGLVNLMARYDFNDSTSIQLNVDNLLDKTYYSQIGYYSQYTYGEPLNATLKLTYRF